MPSLPHKLHFSRLLVVCALLASMAHAQLMERGAKISGTGASQSDGARQGSSVALSADGTTLIEGGPFDGNGRGAAWIFTRSGKVWIQQGEKLRAASARGENVFQGHSVAISADGNTALISGDGDDQGTGAAWVFTRAGGVWNEQAKLLGSGAVGQAHQGSAVALSADGNTAILGGTSDDNGRGAAWVFTRVGDVWTQQGAKLMGSGAVGPASQGCSVALSSDGNIALVGGSADNDHQGAAWIFARSGEAWIQSGDKLVGSGSVGPEVYQGYGAGLSSDGNMAVIGGYGDNHNAGAAWVFTRSGDRWMQTGGKLSSDEAAEQGFSVALSTDGNRVLLGAPADDSGAGAAWEYRRSNGEWRLAGKLMGLGASGKAQQGYAVAMAGGTAVVGGILDGAAEGAVWTFADPVLMISVPASATAGSLVTFTVTSQDDDGNTVSRYAGTLHFGSSDPEADLPNDAPLIEGVGTFSITFKTSGTYTIVAADTVISTIAATSDPLPVRASKFVSASTAGNAHVLLPRATPPTDYVSVVLSTTPIAYFRLEAANDTSQVNGYTSTFQGGATLATPGAPICEANNHNVSLNGATNSIVNTSLSGGVATAGSIAAWVNLTALPSAFDRLLYVAGESHLGNDFDLQFTTDNFVRFYVSNDGINVGYQPNEATLVGQWHLIVATFDSTTNTENLYWDGQLVATANNTVLTNKTVQFAIGASNVFSGRNFDGGIDEVAVWNTALTAAQVSAIYGAAKCTAPVFEDSEPIHVTDSLLLQLSLQYVDNETIHVTDNLILPFQPVTVNVNPPLAGTVTTGGGLFGQYPPGATATITATPNPSYVFANFSGSVPSTSSNPLIVTVTGPLTIVANFTPLEPALRAAVTGARTDGPVPGTRIVPVTIANAGQGAALSTQISSVIATVVSGSLRVTLASGVPSAPVTLAPGASITLPLVFDWPLTATRVSMKFGLNATDASGNSYSATQTVTLFR
jgi:concanavalin A-like lectin/glucanase superfamily protein/List-Bact-rpt repeat protein